MSIPENPKGVDVFKALTGKEDSLVRDNLVEGLVEDVVTDSDEESPVLESDSARLERVTVNRAVRAAFAMNKDEREELYEAKKKLMNLHSLLKTKGLSMEGLEKEILVKNDVFNNGNIF